MTDNPSRRLFLQKAAAATAALAAPHVTLLAADMERRQGKPTAEQNGESGLRPWYRRALRWGQTGVNGKRSRLLVAGRQSSTTVRDGWAGLEIRSLLDHEMIVIQ